MRLPWLKTPIVLLLFNRPDLTEQVFNRIRQARPEHLFLIADGPRLDYPEDELLCAKTREVVAKVDWHCQVKTNFSSINLGDGKRISSGLNWVFEQVEEAIILEDDTLPDPSFFPYCSQLLEYYRNDTQVMIISGYNGLGVWSNSDRSSYFFTRYGSIWGWATWRRTWQLYDFSLERYHNWPVSSKFRDSLGNCDQAEHLTWLFQDLLHKPVNKWDAQLLLICLLYDGLCAIPRANLVRNLGFGERATHTKKENDPRQFSALSLSLPLNHPSLPAKNHIDDRYGRWYYWLQLLAKYENLRFLSMWGRTLKNKPDLIFPNTNNYSAFNVAPLRYPEEVKEMLEYCKKIAPENSRLNELCLMFSSICQS